MGARRGMTEAKWYHILYHLEDWMAITTSEARRDLFGLIERVNLDHSEIEITSKRGSAVLMSKDEYDSLIETSYLLRSPENARRLLSALQDARAGDVESHELVEP
ncbi:type II toxin-antitoxin system prevent-host-death family antitoxin [Microbacterium sp. KSW2-21]|uniref:Antitoxin n=2 Tax=Microbacteriaceae TaxID=85023 RepID=A0ABU3RVP8_9MICO|nr:type II toxin-antitoxin system prevent-host-death family antitoxin [Microbacterium sp. KSW2-21]MDU0326962.1 type II toxin-antitoxin system prevent-host-death family antitoxin [Microbacterium sp. KSW2-21]